MSNGYLVAAGADLATARELGDGFELEVLELAAIGDGAIPMLAAAANVGVVLSIAATRDAAFYALVQKLSLQLPRAQIIVVEPSAQAMFGFFPQSWPVMPMEEARRRAGELKRRRTAPPPLEQATQAPVHAAPLEPQVQEPQKQDEQDLQRQQEQPPTPHQAPVPRPPAAAEIEVAPPPVEAAPEDAAPPTPEVLSHEAATPKAEDGLAVEDNDVETPAPAMAPMHVDPPPEFGGEPPAELHEAPPAPPAKAAPPAAEVDQAEPREEALQATPPAQIAPAPTAPASRSPAPSHPSAAQNSSLGPAPARGAGADLQASRRESAAAALTADASAFAPKKLRRETPELVRVVIYQPHQLKEVLKAAKKIDPRSEAAPQGMRVGEIALGERIGVSLDVRGAACDGALQLRAWNGEPIDFSFTLEAEADVKQAVILARVFVGDAQVGVIGFTRAISGPSKFVASEDRLKLKRHERVFLSYSSQDRATVAAIATAYEAAGIAYFWDRSSLKSGEEWSPRLRKEIDRADLFHLCWSKAASKSEWVLTEAEHALTRRKRSNGKQPDITVQMLDGPPWAPHPGSLDSINFDDFVRAAIVGYARSDSDDAA